MKRKEIQAAIQAAIENKSLIRDKADIYLNTLEFVWNVSDKERCDYYDIILLYIMYGVQPNWDSFSDKKKGNLRLIFSLLKKQRIGFENASKSNNCDNMPMGVTLGATTPQDIKKEDIKKEDIKKEDIKKEEIKNKNLKTEEVKAASVVVGFLNLMKGFYGDIQLTPQQRKVVESKDLDYWGGFADEIQASDWLREHDFGIVLNLHENVVAGLYKNYPGKASKYSKEDKKKIWERFSPEEQRRYLDTHNGLFPWEEQL